MNDLRKFLKSQILFIEVFGESCATAFLVQHANCCLVTQRPEVIL